MLSSLIAAAAFQIGPFYQQKQDYAALRPVAASEGETFDVLWPAFTSHRDWWRFCYIAYWQDFPEQDAWQFALLPVWFNGRDAEKGGYAGLFPVAGHHPHIATLYDFKFCLWPLWMRYSVPRGREWLVTDSVLFPFFSVRSDGAWSVWPLYGVNHRRESDHRYVLWPLVTWASYREDRDTSGEGGSWMFWPLYGRVRRARESQDLFLPPLFSWTETRSPAREKAGDGAKDWRLRCPWPFFEIEDTAARERLSVWPFYENVGLKSYGRGDGGLSSSVTRYGWRLLEFYRDGDGALEEWRLFPFVASGRNYFRLWPFWETDVAPSGVSRSRFLALFPIRWVPAIDRNWAKYWTFYEKAECPQFAEHSLFWGIVRWRTWK